MTVLPSRRRSTRALAAYRPGLYNYWLWRRRIILPPDREAGDEALLVLPRPCTRPVAGEKSRVPEADRVRFPWRAGRGIRQFPRTIGNGAWPIRPTTPIVVAQAIAPAIPGRLRPTRNDPIVLGATPGPLAGRAALNRRHRATLRLRPGLAPAIPGRILRPRPTRPAGDFRPAGRGTARRHPPVRRGPKDDPYGLIAELMPGRMPIG